MLKQAAVGLPVEPPQLPIQDGMSRPRKRSRPAKAGRIMYSNAVSWERASLRTPNIPASAANSATQGQFESTIFAAIFRLSDCLYRGSCGTPPSSVPTLFPVLGLTSCIFDSVFVMLLSF